MNESSAKALPIAADLTMTSPSPTVPACAMTTTLVAVCDTMVATAPASDTCVTSEPPCPRSSDVMVIRYPPATDPLVGDTESDSSMNQVRF